VRDLLVGRFGAAREKRGNEARAEIASRDHNQESPMPKLIDWYYHRNG
jgi:hypothetical protein